jgi:hypothetical protein
MSLGFEKHSIVMASKCFEILTKLKALAVIAGKTDWNYLACTQGNQVLDYISGSPRAVPHTNDLMSRLPGFDRNIVDGRIKLQVLIEKEVTYYGYTPGRKTIEYVL